jgi:hypothetical protein
MNPTIERILMNEWLYTVLVIFLSIQAFGMGLAEVFYPVSNASQDQHNVYPPKGVPMARGLMS